MGVFGEEEGRKKKKKEKRGKKEKSGKKQRREEATQPTTSAPQAGLLDLQLGTPAPQVCSLSLFTSPLSTAGHGALDQ